MRFDYIPDQILNSSDNSSARPIATITSLANALQFFVFSSPI